MDKFDAYYRIVLDGLHWHEARSREYGTKALQLIVAAGALLIAALALLEFPEEGPNLEAKIFLGALLIASTWTGIFGGYVLLTQTLRRDPWQRGIRQQIELLDTDQLLKTVSETYTKVTEENKKILRQERVLLTVAVLGLVAEVIALLILGFSLL